MIVYRNPHRTVDPRALLRSLAADAAATPLSHDAAVRLLVEFGRLESALCDGLMPGMDHDLPAARALGVVALSLGHQVRCSWRGLPPPCTQRDLAGSLAQLEWQIPVSARPLPLPLPEGFTHYGLAPECYLEAAADFARGRPPATALCIGLRSIGTTLSALVAAELESAGWQVTRCTLRPRGHPFDRRPLLAPSFAQMARRHARGWALVVDEGPGLSGSSFAGTVHLLRQLGFDPARIVLFPSWHAEASNLASADARAIWAQQAQYVGDFESLWIASGRLADPPLRSVGAGEWRRLFFSPHAYPAIQPQHERRKYLSQEQRPRMFKFAGLGSHGDAALARAQRLHAGGYIPPVHQLRHGFLVSDFAPGRPLQRHQVSHSLMEFAARYLAFVQRNFPAAEATDAPLLSRMVAENAGEALGHAVRTIPPALFAEGQAVLPDGRMEPWEWLATGNGFLKCDAVDHHQDHFFPGAADIAWDLAGFVTEFGLDAAATAHLLRRFAVHGGDPSVARRLVPWRIAYTAFRVGYTTLAARHLTTTDEARRCARDAARYRRQLQQAFAAWRPARRSA